MKGGKCRQATQSPVLIIMFRAVQVPQPKLSLDGPLSLTVATLDANFCIFFQNNERATITTKSRKGELLLSGEALCVLRGLIGTTLERASPNKKVDLIIRIKKGCLRHNWCPTYIPFTR